MAIGLSQLLGSLAPVKKFPYNPINCKALVYWDVFCVFYTKKERLLSMQADYFFSFFIFYPCRSRTPLPFAYLLLTRLSSALQLRFVAQLRITLKK